MATQIKCSQCGNQIEITEALRAELEQQVFKQAEQKYQQQIKDLQNQELKLKKQQAQDLEKLKKQITEQARHEAIEKVRQQYLAKIESTKEESQEQAERNKELQTEVKELLKQIRSMKDNQDKLELQYEKKMLQEQDKIKQQATKEFAEEYNLKLAERDKQLQDLQKQLQEAQRKAGQGSQQLQGEIQELELEKILKTEFPFDEIKEVPKGIRGADIIQTVRTKQGKICGTIIWESKRTKSWSLGWISKLKQDQRTVKADISILVSSVLPSDISNFGIVDGVLVTNMQSALGLSYLLRQQLIKTQAVRVANQHKSTKAEVVFNYLISNEFKQRIEVWVEYFQTRRQQIDKERMYFNKKWEKEEKEVLKLAENTAGIYGDLQGLIGSALPKVNYLEIENTQTDPATGVEQTKLLD